MSSLTNSEKLMYDVMGAIANDNVIADKISVIASDRVFRRAKDLVDVYALSHCVSLITADIYDIWKRESRAIGTFDAFRNRRDDLQHSYDKLRRIDAKPEFDKLYYHLVKFLQPFVENSSNPKTWNTNDLAWDDVVSEKNPF